MTKYREPAWFSKLSDTARARAQQWWRADPEAFAEIAATDKRGRPKAADGPALPYEEMARLLLDDPTMPIFRAASLSAHLVQDKSVAPRSITIRLERHWARLGEKYLNAERRQRKRKAMPPTYGLGAFDVSSQSGTGQSLFGNFAASRAVGAEAMAAWEREMRDRQSFAQHRSEIESRIQEAEQRSALSSRLAAPKPPPGSD